MNYQNPGDFIPAGAPPHVPCYEQCTRKAAEVATNVTGHSIKVTGAECEDPDVNCNDNIPLGGENDDEPSCLIEVITSSAEQFRESGTYTRSEPCPGSLAVEFAHNRAGSLLTAFGGFDNHNLYKKK